MKYIAYVNGWELCPYCHKLLRASLFINVRNLIKTGMQDLSKSMKYWIYPIYSNTGNPVSFYMREVLGITPVLYFKDQNIFYIYIIDWKMTYHFLKAYFDLKISHDGSR